MSHAHPTQANGGLEWGTRRFFESPQRGVLPHRVMQAAVHTKDIQRDTANAIHAGGFFHL